MSATERARDVLAGLRPHEAERHGLAVHWVAMLAEHTDLLTEIRALEGVSRVTTVKAEDESEL